MDTTPLTTELTNLLTQQKHAMDLLEHGNSYPATGPAARRIARLVRKRKQLQIFGHVTDVNGDLWDVREARGTKHGFELYFGIPNNDHGAYPGGLPRLIVTPDLRDFWLANRTKGHGFLFDLPAGRTTLKRARRRLGINYKNDVWRFWTERVEDLDTLPTRDFAERYQVKSEMANEWRRKIAGRRARPLGWWRKPHIRKILLSDLTLTVAGGKLGISIAHTKRLRDLAKLELIELQSGFRHDEVR